MSIEQHINKGSGQEAVLTIDNLGIQFGMRTVFENLNFIIRKGERIALAGPNGAGKTTLIKSIIGISNPDTGEINRKKGIRISYVPQSSEDIKLDGNSTVDNCIMETSGLSNIVRDLQDVYSRLEKNPEDNKELVRLGELQSTFENLGGYKIAEKTKKILAGLGLGNISFDRKFNTLSGGEKMKVFISIALATEPDLLILDEPTNNIDRNSLDWLGNFLSGYSQSVLAVSHDPDFLDRFVERVVEIVPERSTTVEYKGNYSEFLQKRIRTDELKHRELENIKLQQKEAERIGNKLKAGSRAGVGRGRLVKANKLKEIVEEKSEQVTDNVRKIDLDFTVENLGPKIVMMVSGLNVVLENKIIDYSKLDIVIERGQHWEINGPTGVGKSILLKIITGEIEHDQGNILINDNVNIGFFHQGNVNLEPSNTLIQELSLASNNLNTEKIRSILGHFLFSGDDQLKKVGVLSQGERSRLTLAKLFVGTHNMLILDEPTSHLDILVRRKLIEALQKYNGTIIAVSNDEEFLKEIGIDHQLNLPDCKVTSI